MLESQQYRITKENLGAHELIGLEVKVLESKESSRKGLCGRVVDETKNTLVVETGSGEKIIPKREVVIEFLLGKERVRIDGKFIEEKPENRIKEFWRKKNGMQ